MTFYFSIYVLYLNLCSRYVCVLMLQACKLQLDKFLLNLYETPTYSIDALIFLSVIRQWGARSTDSKLVLQKVKGQTVQGQTAQEF